MRTVLSRSGANVSSVAGSACCRDACGDQAGSGWRSGRLAAPSVDRSPTWPSAPREQVRRRRAWSLPSETTRRGSRRRANRTRRARVAARAAIAARRGTTSSARRRPRPGRPRSGDVRRRRAPRRASLGTVETCSVNSNDVGSSVRPRCLSNNRAAPGGHPPRSAPGARRRRGTAARPAAAGRSRATAASPVEIARRGRARASRWSVASCVAEGRPHARCWSRSACTMPSMVERRRIDAVRRHQLVRRSRGWRSESPARGRVSRPRTTVPSIA